MPGQVEVDRAVRARHWERLAEASVVGRRMERREHLRGA